ncbi:MAG: conjugal transfer protein TraL [Betaproteobacteria bacterium]|nr:conjugal transfer protein TraL [Betaproteobacteria bacterium]
MAKKAESATDQQPAASVHIILQGKGGVGKSLVAAMLAQYFAETCDQDVKCIDTDPVNQTLASYKALQADHIKLMDGSKIDERNFDNLMERLLSEDGVFIVDNGASSFVPLSNYLIENSALEVLREAGRRVFIHSVVTGGQALFDTLGGFAELARQAASNNLVVWLNEYFGAIEATDAEGASKSFAEMSVYVSNQEKVLGIVRIAKRNNDTFGRDIEEMVSSKLTFAEALQNSDVTIMARQRLKIVQKDIYEQLARIRF